MRLLTAVAAAGLVAAAGRADEPPAEKTGLTVGAEAPAFALKDQAGTERTLAEFLKSGKKVALVFHRSADW